MTPNRIETLSDPASGHVFAEVYKGEASAPVMRSAAAFASHDELADQVLEPLRTHFPDHSPFVEDQTIGI
ncbi:hypothetical protein [Novosphingobium sp. AP12]|uniref:hypothetical protein n=1 Tax=Novosphingobium sp. AP12 TaxID=1144305 RepID=UPI0002722483|nr:hypothetical protein [Novosphingobium sp. AP12]EJL22024.1 hypothetical protein PMI02_04810 [Novosphingobium sp. AP12]